MTLLQLMIIIGGLAAGLAIWSRSTSHSDLRDMEKMRALNDDLFSAVAARRPSEVKKLLDVGAHANYYKTNHSAKGELANLRQSVLNVAIRQSDLECMQLLLDAGADPAGQYPVDAAEQIFANKMDDLSRIEMLKVVLPHLKGDSRVRVVDLAIDHGQPQVVSMLREQDFAFGMRELVIAGDLEQAKAAEAAAPGSAKQEVHEYKGCKSLLGIALMKGHQALASWLLDLGLPVDFQSEYGQTAAYMAAMGSATLSLPNSKQLVQTSIKVHLMKRHHWILR